MFPGGDAAAEAAQLATGRGGRSREVLWGAEGWQFGLSGETQSMQQCQLAKNAVLRGQVFLSYNK